VSTVLKFSAQKGRAQSAGEFALKNMEKRQGLSSQGQKHPNQIFFSPCQPSLCKSDEGSKDLWSLAIQSPSEVQMLYLVRGSHLYCTLLSPEGAFKHSDTQVMIKVNEIRVSEAYTGDFSV
jgi:hypothetical protein